MTQLTDKIYAVEVPSMASGIDINNYGDGSEMMYMLSMSDIADDDSAEEKLITKWLPPGTYRFLFTTKTATEDQLTTLDSLLQHNNFKEWFIDFCNHLTYFFTRKESLDSLLLSKKLNPNKNYALIEKQKDGTE